MQYRRKPTAEDAAAVRSLAKDMGYKVRVARTRFSLRLIGATDEVRDVAVLLGLTNASGDSAAAPRTVPNYDGKTEFFAYVAS